MLIGKMNNPSKDLIQEITLTGQQGFDYLDLTLEGPAAYRDQLSPQRVRDALKSHELGVVGHTAYYLPIDSSIDRLQSATISEIIDDLNFFARIKAQKVTLHFGFSNPRKLFSLEHEKELWSRALDRLISVGEELGIQIILEHFTCDNNSISILLELFDRFPSLGFHLDVGHANLGAAENATPWLLDYFSDHLSHVHFSDNLGGGSDLHLPLYCGNIDWEMIVAELKKVDYDDTITLEVFSNHSDYLMLSKKLLEELWRKNSKIG